MSDNIIKKGLIEEFHRYEFKFIVSSRAIVSIQKEIEHFMEYDGFTHKDLKNSYIVRSLYFDNSLASNYYEKIDGVRYRTKFRLRSYSFEHDSKTPIYLEKKGRHLNRVFKSRSNISYNDLDKTYKSERFSELHNIYSNDVFDDFIFQGYRKRLEPKVLVDYVRTPYVSDYDSNFRITIDSSIRVQKSQTLFPDVYNPIEALPGHVIVEVKFHRRIPAWFHRIIQTYNLDRVSVSKFVLGMTKANIAQNLS
jgi:hypothetical protein